MFRQKFVRGSLVLALVLTAGSALAENPARGGYRNSVPLAACASDTREAPSYRGSVARLGIEQSEQRKVASAGYRDRYGRATSKAAPARHAAGVVSRACVH
jgi:hypothetical protein